MMMMMMMMMWVTFKARDKQNVAVLITHLRLFTKEIKNAPECIVELYNHAGIFKNTREVHREARGAAECFSHFSSVLKNSQVLI